MQLVISFFLKCLIFIYRIVISPFTVASCRFQPTCSDYALQALKKHTTLSKSANKQYKRQRPFRTFWIIWIQNLLGLEYFGPDFWPDLWPDFWPDSWPGFWTGFFRTGIGGSGPELGFSGPELDFQDPNWGMQVRNWIFRFGFVCFYLLFVCSYS